MNGLLVEDSHGILNCIFGDVSVAQLVASMSSVVLSGVVQAVGSNLARGLIFRASIGSALHIYIYSLIWIFFHNLVCLKCLN